MPKLILDTMEIISESENEKALKDIVNKIITEECNKFNNKKKKKKII